jgi:hypothetical protein
MIFPSEKVQLPWGPLCGVRLTQSRRELALRRCLEIGRALTERRRAVPAVLGDVCRSAEDGAGWAEAHDRFMADPEVLPHWSVRLSELHPRKGAFRELLFVYE